MVQHAGPDRHRRSPRGMVRRMRIALAQQSPVAVDIEANARTSEALIRSAAEGGAALVVFPELWLTGYELERIAADPRLWLGERDARLDGIVRACVAAKITAILGAPWKPGDHPRPQLAAIVVHRDGSVHASAKLHLHGREREVFEAAAPAPPFVLEGWRVAIAICFDVANPPHAAAAAEQGAELYVGSALYTVGEERRSDLHFGARAMDHRMFSALANYAAGTSGGLTSCGLSGVWKPDGEVLCRAGQEATLLFADLDRAAISAYR
jgi:5-aminopentanamidase